MKKFIYKTLKKTFNIILSPFRMLEKMCNVVLSWFETQPQDESTEKKEQNYEQPQHEECYTHSEKKDPNKILPTPSWKEKIKKRFDRLKLNEGPFHKFSKTLRPHQWASINSLENQLVGQINIPTGTGKTRIQKYIHIKDMIDRIRNNKECGIYAIAAHRLILCNQLFDRFIKLMKDCHISANYLYVGSEDYDFGDLRKYGVAVKSTTNELEILKMADESKRKNRHLLIVSTYHSFDLLKELSEINICTFDEAHTTVGNNFRKNIDMVPNIEKRFFFTATVKEEQIEDDFYGDIRYSMSARAAIKASEIVAPMIHEINLDQPDGLTYKQRQKNYSLLAGTIVEAFHKHKEQIRKYPQNKDGKMGAKLLVTVGSLEQIRELLEAGLANACIKSLDKIRLFTFSSNKVDGYNYTTKDGKLVEQCQSKSKILTEMNDMKDSDNAIIFHYDILTEGIDLPAITGVLLLRPLKDLKLLQNIGRACRLLKTDRDNIYANKIQNKEQDMIKPYSWIIIPTYLHPNSNACQDIINRLRNSYGVIIIDAKSSVSKNNLKQESKEVKTSDEIEEENISGENNQKIHNIEQSCQDLEDGYNAATVEDRAEFLTNELNDLSKYSSKENEQKTNQKSGLIHLSNIKTDQKSKPSPKLSQAKIDQICQDLKAKFNKIHTQGREQFLKNLLLNGPPNSNDPSNLKMAASNTSPKISSAIVDNNNIDNNNMEWNVHPVVKEMQKGINFRNACRKVAQDRQVTHQTVADGCTRMLGLTTEEFMERFLTKAQREYISNSEQLARGYVNIRNIQNRQ